MWLTPSYKIRSVAQVDPSEWCQSFHLDKIETCNQGVSSQQFVGYGTFHTIDRFLLVSLYRGNVITIYHDFKILVTLHEESLAENKINHK